MITMNDIVEEGHPSLRKQAEPVKFPLDSDTYQLGKDMLEFLINSQDEETAEKYGLRAGVGLAATQLNINKQIFAVHVMDYDEDGYETEPLISEVLFNPRIISHSVQKAALKEGEGCLSVNREVPGLVPRSKRIRLEYQDFKGDTYELKLRDYLAVVTQHELDHLKGIMFYDHINKEEPWSSDKDTTLL
ncbi:peptide deformylase [Fundicoccus sp. Sow4_D5]|uniref:peptide deformylase n=1 Tax=unclassified Fundicoccus TaxID=2761543 RepID=UPI003F904965